MDSSCVMHERLRVMASDRYHAISAPPCPIPRTSLALQWAQSCSGRAAQGPSPHPCSGQHSRSSRSHTRRWLQGQAAGVEQGTADSHCNMAAKQTLSKHRMVVANHGRLSHPRVVILQHKAAVTTTSAAATCGCRHTWMSLPLHSSPPPYPGGGS